MLWIPLTVAATGLQVARNALQRGLLAGAGPWGASLVRFLYGLPFALLFFGLALALSPHAHPRVNPGFFLDCAIGGGAQIVATEPSSSRVAYRWRRFSASSWASVSDY
jgi:hypothetical protein